MPAGAEAAQRGFGLCTAFRQIDGRGSGFYLGVVAFAGFFQNVAHLVHPAALMPYPRG